MLLRDPRQSFGRYRVSLPAATLLFVFCVCITISALQAVRIVEQRSEALAAGKTETENLVLSLSQHATLSFRSADTILSGLVERLQAGDLLRQGGDTRLLTWFESVLSKQPQFKGLYVVNAEGDIVVSSSSTGGAVHVGDRDYFIRHLRAGAGLFIGSPVKDRESGRWAIPVSRRFDSSDGNLAGVATLLMDLTSLQNLYEQFDIGKEGAILLMSEEMRLLVRRPFVEANIGRDMSQSNIAKALGKKSSGTIEIKATTDNTVRLNSYLRSEDYSFVLVVARSSEEILAPWRSRAVKEAGQTGLLLAIICGGGLFVARFARRLTSAKSNLDVAIEAMPQGLCLFDENKRLVVSNSRFRDIYGYPTRLTKAGTNLKEILEHYAKLHPDHAPRQVDEYIENLSRDGGESLIDLKGRVISITRKPTSHGGWVAVHDDITERRANERRLAESSLELRKINEYFRTVIENLPEGICLFDREQKVIVSNRRYAELYGLTLDDIAAGKSLQSILERRIVMRTNTATLPEQYTSVNVKLDREIAELADGRTISIRRQMLSDGGWLTTHEDITQKRQKEQHIAYLASHDPLTGLPNRARFVEVLAAAIAEERIAALMLIDLDRFKSVNDTLGHAAGDQLLQEVASRMRNEIREGDSVARLGGDEFAVIQRLDRPEHEPVISLGLRLIEVLSKPYDIGGNSVSIGASIGVSLIPEHGRERSELMKKADLALYAVKEAGRNDLRIYDAELADGADHQQLLQAELAAAIDADQLEVHYQPIVDAASESIVAAEALVRWNHPERGVLSPGEFIPLAEECGLVVPLGEWVLQRACRDAATWPDHLKLSVNISAVQVKRRNLFEVVLCTVLETGMSPQRLELEITESALLESQPEHQRTLRQLKDMGVTIVLDDFGTGYSSAQYLTLYPIDKIKIDRSFVEGLGRRRDCGAIIASSLVLAKNLDILVTAEGVETEEQRDRLRFLKVDFMQGYRYGRPLPIDAFMARLRSAAARDVA